MNMTCIICTTRSWSSCGIFSILRNRRLFLLVQSENILVIRKAAVLIHRAFGTEPEVSVLGNGDWKKGRLYTLALLEPEQVDRVLKALKMLSQRGALRDPELPVNGILLQDVDGFEGMTYAESLYVPMIEVVEYLQENGFKTYVVSGSDRSICRVFLEGMLDIPYEQIIGMDVHMDAANQGDTDGLD